MKLSVVIPAYNEEKDIAKAVDDVYDVFPEAEIIVVNDASTDKTLDELSQFTPLVNLKVLTNEKNRGHGYSVVKGLSAATGDYVLYIDADRQIRLDMYPNIVKFAEGFDFDVVSGWRVGRQDKLFRKIISFCLKTTNLVFHHRYIKDANCPFKLYKRSSLTNLLPILPTTYIVPIACLEVLARRYKLKTTTLKTPHLPYQGVRQGFLQVPDAKAWRFFRSAFFEVVSL